MKHYKQEFEYLGLFQARLSNLPPSDEANRAKRMVDCYKDRLMKAANYYEEYGKPYYPLEQELQRVQDAIGRILFIISPTEDR